MSWAERIVGRGQVAPASLKPHPGNWREHPPEQLEALARILGDVGQIAPVIVSKRTNHVLNGHARLRLAIDQGLDTVEVVWVDVPEADELAVLASFDAVAMLRDVRQRRAMDLMRSTRVQQHGDWLQATLGAPELAAFPDGEAEAQSSQSKRKRRKRGKRNRAWYVYAPNAEAEAIGRWLEQEFEGVDGVEVGGE